MKPTRKATYQDADLLLDLYEKRREEKMREARDWFIHAFHVSTYDEFVALCPPGSTHNAYFRMMVTYWDMAASMVVAGVLEPRLFFRSGREMLFVWERIRPVVAAIREANQDPRAWHNLEQVAADYIAWLNEQGPKSYQQWLVNISRLKRD